MPKFPIYGVHPASGGGRPFRLWGQSVQETILEKMRDLNFHDDWTDFVVDYWIELHPYYEIRKTDLFFSCCGSPRDDAAFRYSIDGDEAKEFLKLAYIQAGQHVPPFTQPQKKSWSLLSDITQIIDPILIAPGYLIPQIKTGYIRFFCDFPSHRHNHQRETELEWEYPVLGVKITNNDDRHQDFGRWTYYDLIEAVSQNESFDDFREEMLNSLGLNDAQSYLQIEVLDAPVSWILDAAQDDFGFSVYGGKNLRMVESSALEKLFNWALLYREALENIVDQSEIIKVANDKTQEDASQLFTQLNKEYDYMGSDEAVIETIEANDYLFDREGNIV
jgi:hypothetical protein